MKIKKFFVIILFFYVVSFINFLNGESNNIQFTKTDNVKLFKESNANSNVIKNLKKNAPLTILDKKGKFVYVDDGANSKGWVFEFNLTSKNPQSQQSSSKLLDGLANDDYTSRESSTKANIRGLTEMSKEYAENKNISKKAINTVIKMEKYKISEKDLDKFMKEGKLGEYTE